MPHSSGPNLIKAQIWKANGHLRCSMSETEAIIPSPCSSHSLSGPGKGTIAPCYSVQNTRSQLWLGLSLISTTKPSANPVCSPWKMYPSFKNSSTPLTHPARSSQHHSSPGDVRGLKTGLCVPTRASPPTPFSTQQLELSLKIKMRSHHPLPK